MQIYGGVLFVYFLIEVIKFYFFYVKYVNVLQNCLVFVLKCYFVCF